MKHTVNNLVMAPGYGHLFKLSKQKHTRLQALNEPFPLMADRSAILSHDMPIFTEEEVVASTCNDKISISDMR